MNRSQTFLPIIIFMIVAGMLFSFNAKNSKPPFAMIIYSYHGNCQKVTVGVSGQEDAKENSLCCAELTNPSNWSPSSKGSFGSGTYIAAISFDEEKDEDGGNDGQLTLSEASSALCDYYLSRDPHELPSSGRAITIGKAEITVYRKSAI